MDKKLDITMIIGTCDKYDMFWENFMILCDKFWQIDCRKIWIGETKKVPSTEYETHLPGAGLPWSNRILSALNTVDTKYIFQMAEDFYLREPITHERISKYINFLDKRDGNKMLIAPYDNPAAYTLETKLDEGFFKLNNNSDYQTSVMPSVWKTDWIKEVLLPNWDPWQFEITGTNRIKGQNNKVYMDIQEYPGIAPGICRRGGKLIKDWEYTYDKFGLTKPLTEQNQIIFNNKGTLDYN